MTSFTAKVVNITKPIIAKVTTKQFDFDITTNSVLVSSEVPFTIGHSAIITTNNKVSSNAKSIAYDVSEEFIKKISSEDVINIMPDGKINILWEKKINPYDVTLFITNQCNANCVMCPQPPEKDEYSLLTTNLLLLKYTKNQPIRKIGITGGEPTIKKKDLTLLLKKAYQYFPDADIDLLTNAKKLANFDFAKELSVSNPNITFCISFPSDNKSDFDNIIGIELFTDVLKAIQNLAILKQNIELRIVITKKNYKRLLAISEFIYRNFPFVFHITFMGMEVVGYAFDNYDELEVDTKDFNENLLNAIQFLNQRQMNVSIYNIPYCLIDMKIWKFLRNSISAWKQNYKQECNICVKRTDCPGVFSTSKISNFKIKAIKF